MKKRTRPLALLMAAAILGSTLSACGGGSDSGTNGSDSAVEGLAEDMALTDAPAEEITLPISTDGLELSFFAMPEPVITSKMKGYSEMTVHQTAEELTGVHINWREESYTDPKQKMNLMFSTGDTEDIVWDAWKHASGGPKKLLDEGLIVSLNPYIEKYAPNLKKLLQETPGLLEQISTDDGRIFMFPTIRLDPITRANSGFAIRKDWLDRAGLPVPETIDEWYTMLKTFQDMDMNGNGLKDECFVSMGFEKTSQSMDNFAVAYGLVAGTDLYVKDGQVKYGAYEPEFKDFVAEMAKWYSEGLLDPEFSTQDSKQFDSKMVNDMGGAYYGSLSGNMGKFITARSDDSEYDLVPAPMPKAPDGKVHTGISGYGQMVPHGASICSTNENIVETVKWLDWHYSEEGTALYNWGIEGQSYEVVDGKNQFTDLITNNPDGLSKDEADARYAGGVLTQMPIVEDPEVFLALKSLPQQKAASQLWCQADTSWLLSPLYFDSETTTENANIMSEIKTYVAEQFNKYVMGIESMDTFDQFQQQLKNMGIETVLANYQASYDAVYKN
jgi:putative aldouronate transport system substrate-binding protein